MFAMNKKFLTKAFTEKSIEITQINANIAEMILNKKASLLSNSIEEMEFLFASRADTFLKGDTKKFENDMLKLYDDSFAKYIDIFFFRSVDGKYLFDASSPFYDTSRIRNYMIANSSFIQKGPRIIQSESSDGILVALSGSSEAVSGKTGELAGYFFAGILINNSSDLIREIIDATNISEAALIYGDSIISGNLSKSPDTVIASCYNLKQAFIDKDEVSYCSDITLGNGGITLKFYQSLPDAFVRKINSQHFSMGYTAIAIVLILTIITGYLINLATVKSLYRLVDYTKYLLSGEESVKYQYSLIYEFNLLAQQIAFVSNDLTETQAYLKNLITNAEAPISIWDKNGNITLFNSALEKLSGYESVNVVGKHLSHIYSIFPDANVPVAIASKEPSCASRFESMVINKQTNAEKFVLWNLTDIFNEGAYAGTILQGIDITDRKDAEAKLFLASKVFENTMDGMVIINNQGLIVSCNNAFVTMTGFKEHEISGKYIDVLKCEKHDASFYNNAWSELYKYGRWSGEVWQKRNDGELFPSILTISCIRNNDGDITNYILVVHDITERKNYENHIKFQATHDILTGLPNRLHFVQMISESIDNNDGISKIAVLFLDLDRFKNLNDTLGHSTGDRVLEIISERIINKIRTTTSVARFSGDEFAILFTDLKNKDEAVLRAKVIIETISAPIIVQGYELFIQMSAGLSYYPENGKTATELIKNAEIAMYQAKQKGRNNLQHFTGGLDTMLRDRLMLESKLNRAIENNELSLHYQPKIDLASMKVMGMEALLRWNNPELGNVPPDVFITIAEENGLILPIGEWVINKALEDTAALHAEGFDWLKIAVNLSLRQFMKKDLVPFVKDAIAKSGIRTMSFEFEITENIFSEDLSTISKIMNDISDLDVKFAIDDFGTGYSSIGYLKKMPISTLKIDRSYISAINTDPESETIVSSVILMAKSLGLAVVAEGAEEEAQVELLKQMGCSIVQGFYFGKPLPLDEFRNFVKNWK